MKTTGICFGSTTMQCVRLAVEGEQKIVEEVLRVPHEGNPRKALIEFLSSHDRSEFGKIAVTGRTFRNSVKLTGISEPEAIELALKESYLLKEKKYPDIVISSGGETQLVYIIGKQGGISSVHSGNKCASGTGEFFLQQIRRMGLTLEEAVVMAGRGNPHKIAGRCSVFCKSDCTHALNKGESRENICAGLCLMMADKITDLVKDLQCESAALIGGGSLNTAMVEILKTRFSTLDIPENGHSFEAFGAAIWASQNDCLPLPENFSELSSGHHTSFGRHRPLKDAEDLVDFKHSICDKAQDGDRCILGLDVGSTTTKAVLVRKSDSKTLASVYIRTNGDPVQASKNCYLELQNQIDETEIEIIGLGVTGSGRQIAALHALTDCIINEIIAHATAASYFDSEVDTIFEIGGQDAKYTLLTGGVPSDYAMNEACSAGTGSFLEESARESLNVKTEEIGELALRGNNPPNFTDQCSAFISSDIKIAGQEGVEREDILGGLVYSICMNYLNRVKGSRPVGKKIFMQGGVCYNRAVPVAMASLMNIKIIVPPEPGLMGAFGVALEVSKRIELGIVKETSFDLKELIERTAIKEGSFTCNGGVEKCDRKCQIAKIRINNKVYAFGGICNKYYNLRLNREVDSQEYDLVALRQRLAFEKYGVAPVATSQDLDKPGRTVGLMRSFLTHSFYPLYSNFFDQLGFRIIYPEEIDPEGISRIESAFCLPAEITHGSFFNLLKKYPDYIFVPQVSQIPVRNVPTYSRTCVFVQGEPYYLRATFRKELEQLPVVMLSPVLRLDKSYNEGEEAIVTMAKTMGVGEKRAREAYRFACDKQRAFEAELLEIGKLELEKLKNNPDSFGVVLFGRPYNSFTNDANMGIPHKVASRGIKIIPFDMLSVADYPVDFKMFWGMGQKIMKAAQFVKEQENLFGFYITNFSCGPDSFLISFFRRLMQQKPSLTLELDQHTADAGIDTRIEAAIDIMKSYRRLRSEIERPREPVSLAKVVFDKDIKVISSDGEEFPINHPNVEVILPSMGKYATESVAAVFRSLGINAKALEVADKDVLLVGRKNTSGKECLPYIVTTGSFLKYMQTEKDPNKITLFFMATGGGPCRLGQYCRALDHLIEANRFRNTAVFTMTDENGYGGLGSRILLKGWQAIIVADIFGDMRSLLSVAAKDRQSALKELESAWAEFLAYCEGQSSIRFTVLLSEMARKLSKIPLKKNPHEVPVVSIIGEIFVRRDEFSRKNIIDYLENHGFMARVAPVAEFMCYSNYVVNSGLGERVFTFREHVKMRLTAQVQEWWERKIKSILSESGLYKFEMVEVDKTISGVRHLVNENFRGEVILTVGLGLREILNDSCGVIAIGPFGCMPSRVAEAILKKEMNVEGKKRCGGPEKIAEMFSDIESFPFLSIETDGSPFPQLIEANMEAFVLQARRIHERLTNSKTDKKNRYFSAFLFDCFNGNGKQFTSGKFKK